MASYKNFILTDRGIGLLGDLMNGSGEMEFRCLAVGSGSYAAEKNTEEIRGMKELKEERQRVLFSSIVKAEDGFVNLKANITNKDLKEGYPMTEAGIYVGKKGEQEEILYCVSTVDKPDYMPDYSLKQIYNVIFKILINIGDVSNPTISYKTDTYALAEDLQIERERATEAEDELRQQKLDVDGDASDITVDFRESEELILLDGLHKLSELFGASAKAVSSLIAHLEDKNNPHEVSREQMQVDKVDNTSDMEKPVSTAQQAALDVLHAQLAAYTDKAVADLINGAPSTLDTLGEIAKAMAENADVVSALNEAIGKKANEAEFDSHVKDTTAHVTAADRDTWNNKLSTAGGTVSGNIAVSGVINAGSNVSLYTNTEGGNIRIVSPDGTVWEVDAHNGNLRIFTYANNVKTGIVINKQGQVSFPVSMHGILYGGFHGSMVAEGGVGGRGIHANANEFGIDLPPEEGYAGGLTWYQGSTAVGLYGYYKQGNYHYVGTDYENPAGELRTGVIRANSNVFIKFPHALYARHIEGADGGNLFLNYNQPDIAVAVGDTGNRVGGTGILLAGAKASIWTDSEGGNMSIVSPNRVEYQMDAYNDLFRLYGYPEGSTGRILLKTMIDGSVDFPQGIFTGKISNRASSPSTCLVIDGSLNNTNTRIEIGYEEISGDTYTIALRPYRDAIYALGLPSKRWTNIFSATSVISTSDETTKKNITPLDENLTKDFIMGINPISYIKTDGESGRTHYGLGAQSVERLMEELGMTSMDFAGLIKSPMYEDYEVEEEVEVEKLIPNENGKPIPQKVKEMQKVTKQREIPGEYRYGLRYEEFIAPTIKFCQMLQDQMNTLKAENQELKDRLARVEKMLGI